jgi:hypothetical protein
VGAECQVELTARSSSNLDRCAARQTLRIIPEQKREQMAERIYLQHPATHETVAVATGFSWHACLLGPLWAVMRRLWLVALLMLVVDVLITAIGLAGVAADLASLVLSIAFAAYCGVNGNKWHRQVLERKGFAAV